MTQSFIPEVDAAGKAAANHNRNDNMPVAAIMVFDNPEFGRVRISLNEKGEPLFCGKDVCEALGYRRTADAINQHVDISDSVKHRIRCEGLRCGEPVMQNRSFVFVTESGLYSLVFGSKLDSAQKFKLWVTSVVLPQIRKTGGYVPLHEADTPDDIRQRAEEVLSATLAQRDGCIARQKKLIAEQDERIRSLDRQVGEQLVRIQKSAEEIVGLERDVDRLLPKALYADRVLESISCYTTTQVAKELGLTAQELNRLLCAEHVQYYQSGQYMLYAEYAHRGLARSRTRLDLFAGRENVYTRMYLVWTERGRKFIHELARKAFSLLQAVPAS